MSALIATALKSARFIPITDVKVGDGLPSWLGIVSEIRDTPRRRYITVTREDGSTMTDYQDNRTQIFTIAAEDLA